MKNNVILWDRSRCEACYSCIRACPVKAIHVKGDSVFPTIEEERCNHCGQCISACAYGAISYYNSITDVKKLFNSEFKVAAICAPSIAGEFADIADYRRFVQMIRYLGFDYVHEMSFGVDVVAAKFKELIAPFKGKYYLTSHCPAAVELVEKVYPEQIGNLAPILPPAAATAMIIRKLHGQHVKTVHITACISAKATIDRYQDEAKIDAVITFEELRQLFDEFKIKEALTEFSDFDPPYGYKGGLYPIPKGFLEAGGLQNDMLDSVIQTVDGQKNVLQAIDEFKSLTEDLKSHFNILLCKGCISGPGMSQTENKYLKRRLTKDYIIKRIEKFDKDKWEKEVAKYAQELDLSAQFTPHLHQLPAPEPQAIERWLQYITEPKNGIELNCGACGYPSCRALALAVAQKIAIPEMCVPNSRIGSQEARIAMRAKDEEIKKSHLLIEKLEGDCQQKLDEATSLRSALSIMIKTLNAGMVLIDNRLKVLDSNLGFINILGNDAREIHEVIPFLEGADAKSLLPEVIASQLAYFVQHNISQITNDVEIEGKLVSVTLFHLVPQQLIGILLRNLHSVEERPEEVITRIEEVIEGNLRQVQEIAFVLGEGAAKTEKMLNSIIQTYK